MSIILAAWVASLGLNCSNPTLESGWQCILKVAGYPEPVAIFIPPGFIPPSPKDHGALELDIHLHGHLRENETFENVLNEFQFGKMLAQTNRNSILVVPSSLGACKTYEQYLTDEASFKKFVKNISAVLGNARIVRRVLSGHSGAYRTIASIIDFWNPNELYLFDALYGFPEKYSAFLIKHPRVRFWSVYTNRESSLLKSNFLLWKALHLNKYPNDSSSDEALFAAFSNDLQTYEKIKDASQLPQVGQVYTDKGHWESVNFFFPIFFKVPPAAYY